MGNPDLVNFSTDVTLTVPSAWQGVIIGIGDGQDPVWISDSATPEDIREWIKHPTERKVAIVRLRQIIAALEEHDLAKLEFEQNPKIWTLQ